MGGNITRQLVEKGWKTYKFNRTYLVTEELLKEGVYPTSSIKQMVEKLASPRVM